VNLASITLWGFLATIVLTTTLAASQWLGWTRMAIPFMLGTMITPDRMQASWLGFLAHFVNGWIFAFVYALVFEDLNFATWWLGGIGGLVHAVFVLLVIIPLLPAVHPRMASEDRGPTPTRQLQPPGFLALHYGRRTPILTVVAHVAYGALLGAFYTVNI
jgi:hypothetical protein